MSVFAPACTNSMSITNVLQWINSDLTPSLGLDKSQKDKSGLYVDDLDRVLYHLWVDDKQVMTHERLRAQMALILIVAAATSTRPNALIGKVLYRHVEFQIFRPAKGSTSARIGLVWDLQHVKEKAGSRMIFGLHEEPNLLHDPVAHMLALALADKAFLNDITGLDQLHSMQVPDRADRIRLPWSHEWMSRPIFRNTEMGPYGQTMSLTEPFPYEAASTKLRRLGRATGYQKDLVFYDIRRGSGKRLNGKCPRPTTL